MRTVCLVWGIVAMVCTVVGFVPSLREINWIGIPFGALGALVCFMTLVVSKEKEKRNYIIGVSLCVVAVTVAILVLVIAGVTI